MKSFILFLALVCSSATLLSQSDTLYTRNRQKIACKIVEINDLEIKYQLAAIADGPLYVINKEKVSRYQLRNGFTEILVPDELLVENQHAKIMDRRSVVKFHPFSFVNSQLSFGFERVLQVGTNLDVEAGYMNANINYNYPLSPVYTSGGQAFYSGAYIKPGVKFFIGQDFSLKGMRYAHPLKGRYIKIEAAVSFMKYNDVVQSNYYYNGTPQTQTFSSDISFFSYGGFINYGRQFILGNVLTLEYYFGVGFTTLSVNYSDPDFKKNMQGSFERFSTTNFHGFMRTPGLGLSGTAGFRIGYILPEKQPKKPSSQAAAGQ